MPSFLNGSAFRYATYKVLVYNLKYVITEKVWIGTYYKTITIC